MVAVPPLAWLDYAGQTLQELLACKDTHRLDAILCAVEEGLEAESKERALTEEEQFVLAAMALDREVNNGGYRQFFGNSSRRFVPIIVDSLRRIECEEAAAITGKAFRGPVAVLDECDHKFYQLDQIGPKLFRFLEVHQGRIRLSKRSVPPRLAGISANISKLYVHLQFARPEDLSLEAIRALAQDLAEKQSIQATDNEIEGAAVLYLLQKSIKARDLAASEPLVQRALDLAREDTMLSVLHRKSVELLIAESQTEEADAFTLMYLEYLNGADRRALGTQNRIKFWAAVLQAHPAALPHSVRFFAANFQA